MAKDEQVIEAWLALLAEAEREDSEEVDLPEGWDLPVDADEHQAVVIASPKAEPEKES